MTLHLLIETEPSSVEDFAPKEFEGRGRVANVLDILVYALRNDPVRVDLTWCGRKVISVTLTQKED